VCKARVLRTSPPDPLSFGGRVKERGKKLLIKSTLCISLLYERREK
jgi:hypothetical protein